MTREFLINLIFLLVINAVIKPVYIFAIDRNVQNLVGSDYGIYFALLSFSYLFQIVNDFGLQNFNSRNLSRHRQLIHRYLPGMLQLKSILGLLYALLVFVVAWIVGYSGNYLHLLLWIVGIQILTSFLLYMRSNVAGLGFYRMDSILSITDKTLLILSLGAIFLHGPWKAAFRIEWFLYAQAGALTVAIAVAAAFLWPRVRISVKPVKLSFLFLILRQSYPYALIYILMMISSRIDVVMMERMLPDGVQESFVYASAYRLLDAANMMSYLFIGLLLPMFSRMIAQKEAIAPLFEVSMKLLGIATVCIALPVMFYATPIMELLYDFGSGYSGSILRILMGGYICISFAHVFGALLIAEGAVRRLNFIFTGGILINITLNLIFIPLWKAYGAAFSTLLTEAYLMIALGLLIGRTFKGLWKWKLIAKILGFIVLTAFALFTIGKQVSMDWRILYFITLVTCLALAVILRMLPSRAILQVFRFNQAFHDSAKQDQDEEPENKL